MNQRKIKKTRNCKKDKIEGKIIDTDKCKDRDREYQNYSNPLDIWIKDIQTV